jgi:hypothetical protein
LLLDELFETIYPEVDVLVERGFSPQGRDNFLQKIWLSPAEIPLRQVKNATSLAAYQSAIALKLASGSRKESYSLGYQFAENFRKFGSFHSDQFSVTRQILREFTVRVTETGYLEFMLSDRGLAIWLRFLIKNPPQVPFALSPLASQLPKNDLFLCQHTHARCVALIRLAEQVGVYTDAETMDEPCFCHPTERDLIFLTISVMDALYDVSVTHSPQTILKRTIAIAQAFQGFYSSCRIFEEPSPARLGLVIVTQRLLRSLLQKGLGVCAPFEL